jgi:hypothetical protein
LAPGSAALAEHPPAVYLREDPVRDGVNGWLGRLFDREHVDTTVADLVGSQGGDRGSGNREMVKKRLADAEARLRRFQAAIEAGVDPTALVEAINEAQAIRAATRAEMEGTSAPDAITEAEVYARIDSLADTGASLSKAGPETLASFYTAVDLQGRYEHETQVADVTIQPVTRVNSVRVRGGNRTRVRGIHARDACSCDGP